MTQNHSPSSFAHKWSFSSSASLNLTSWCLLGLPPRRVDKNRNYRAGVSAFKSHFGLTLLGLHYTTIYILSLSLSCSPLPSHHYHVKRTGDISWRIDHTKLRSWFLFKIWMVVQEKPMLFLSLLFDFFLNVQKILYEVAHLVNYKFPHPTPLEYFHPKSTYQLIPKMTSCDVSAGC